VSDKLYQVYIRLVDPDPLAATAPREDCIRVADALANLFDLIRAKRTTTLHWKGAACEVILLPQSAILAAEAKLDQQEQAEPSNLKD
jgi:hypothetical protein